MGDRAQTQLSVIKNDVNTYSANANKIVSQIGASINVISELTKLLDQNQSEYFQIISNYNYEDSYAGALATNVEPRYSSSEMTADTETISQLRATSSELESEKAIEISRLERSYVELGQTLQAIKESAYAVSDLWASKIASKELY